MQNHFDALTEEQIAVERTRNYIKFQIHQTEEMLGGYSSSDLKICYAHLLERKKVLLNELHELNRSHRRN